VKLAKGDKMNEIALIVPMWNEHERGSFSYLEALINCKNINFIFVNDGSTDRTRAILSTFESRSNVQVINKEMNEGKSLAIYSGFSMAVAGKEYSYIGFLDGDGAFPISEVIRISELAKIKIGDEKYDMVCSSRVGLSGHNIQRKPHRHFLGRIIRTIIGMKHKELPYDTQSGFKIFHNDQVFHQAISSAFLTRWFLDVEIILRMRKIQKNFKIWEEPIIGWRDQNKSSLGILSMPSVLLQLSKVLRLR
jgi:glycosyltransferase involved in cell wall biosynthesis